MTHQNDPARAATNARFCYLSVTGVHRVTTTSTSIPWPCRLQPHAMSASCRLVEGERGGGGCRIDHLFVKFCVNHEPITISASLSDPQVILLLLAGSQHSDHDSEAKASNEKVYDY